MASKEKISNVKLSGSPIDQIRFTSPNQFVCLVRKDRTLFKVSLAGLSVESTISESALFQVSTSIQSVATNLINKYIVVASGTQELAIFNVE